MDALIYMLYRFGILEDLQKLVVGAVIIVVLFIVIKRS